MLFTDILDRKTKEISPEFDRIFFDVLANQSHKCDLLLIDINGFYNPEVHKWNNIDGVISPYLIGPNTEGHSEDLHYKFIHHYRTTQIYPKSFTEYQQEVSWSADRISEINKLVDNESISIQLEMLIYLKIWEADMMIKRFYQVVRLLHGEPYDWHFKILESSRDKKGTGNRDEILRKKIRNSLETSHPMLYEIFKNAFKTQLRNSIAHSKYSFHGRHIHLNNSIKDDPHSQMEVVSFDEWADIFHDTMIIYNQYINFFNKAAQFYGKMAEGNDNLLEIRIERKDPVSETKYCLLKHRPEFRDWSWVRK